MTGFGVAVGGVIVLTLSLAMLAVSGPWAALAALVDFSLVLWMVWLSWR